MKGVSFVIVPAIFFGFELTIAVVESRFICRDHIICKIECSTTTRELEPLKMVQRDELDGFAYSDHWSCCDSSRTRIGVIDKRGNSYQYLKVGRDIIRKRVRKNSAPYSTMDVKRRVRRTVKRGEVYEVEPRQILSSVHNSPSTTQRIWRNLKKHYIIRKTECFKQSNDERVVDRNAITTRDCSNSKFRIKFGKSRTFKYIRRQNYILYVLDIRLSTADIGRRHSDILDCWGKEKVGNDALKTGLKGIHTREQRAELTLLKQQVMLSKKRNQMKYHTISNKSLLDIRSAESNLQAVFHQYRRTIRTGVRHNHEPNDFSKQLHQSRKKRAAKWRRSDNKRRVMENRNKMIDRRRCRGGGNTRRRQLMMDGMHRINGRRNSVDDIEMSSRRTNYGRLRKYKRRNHIGKQKKRNSSSKRNCTKISKIIKEKDGRKHHKKKKIDENRSKRRNNSVRHKNRVGYDKERSKVGVDHEKRKGKRKKNKLPFQKYYGRRGLGKNREKRKVTNRREDSKNYRQTNFIKQKTSRKEQNSTEKREKPKNKALKTRHLSNGKYKNSTNKKGTGKYPNSRLNKNSKRGSVNKKSRAEKHVKGNGKANKKHNKKNQLITRKPRKRDHHVTHKKKTKFEKQKHPKKENQKELSSVKNRKKKKNGLRGQHLSKAGHEMVPEEVKSTKRGNKSGSKRNKKNKRGKNRNKARTKNENKTKNESQKYTADKRKDKNVVHKEKAEAKRHSKDDNKKKGTRRSGIKRKTEKNGLKTTHSQNKRVHKTDFDRGTITNKRNPSNLKKTKKQSRNTKGAKKKGGIEKAEKKKNHRNRLVKSKKHASHGARSNKKERKHSKDENKNIYSKSIVKNKEKSASKMHSPSRRKQKMGSKERKPTKERKESPSVGNKRKNDESNHKKKKEYKKYYERRKERGNKPIVRSNAWSGLVTGGSASGGRALKVETDLNGALASAGF